MSLNHLIRGKVEIHEQKSTPAVNLGPDTKGVMKEMLPEVLSKKKTEEEGIFFRPDRPRRHFPWGGEGQIGKGKTLGGGKKSERTQTNQVGLLNPQILSPNGERTLKESRKTVQDKKHHRFGGETVGQEDPYLMELTASGRGSGPPVHLR